MEFKKRTFLLFCFVFLFSFFWMLSLTYNFNFFWEDSTYLRQYASYAQNPQEYTLSKITTSFIKASIEPKQFSRVEYHRRPLEHKFLYPFLVALFGVQVLFYRIGIALLFGCFITLCFAFLYRLGEENISDQAQNESFILKILKPTFFIPICIVLYISILPTTWLMTLYASDDLLISLLFTTTALFLFYFFYNNDAIQNRSLLSILFFFIVFFTDLSILTNQVGRINIIILSLFLLFTERKKLATFRYFSLLFVLLFLSFPILGFFRLFAGENILNILGIGTHLGVDQGIDTFQLFVTFIKTFHLTFLPHAFFLLCLFLIFFFLHLYSLFIKKEKREDTKTTQQLRSFVLFSFFWFFLSSFIFYIARGFVFDPHFFLRFGFTLFIIPQTFFLVGYVLFVYKKYVPEKKIFQYIIYMAFLLALMQNLQGLNEWRGGWGAYFLGYDTARQYVDDHSQNAILLLPFDHASPTYFAPPSTNQHNMVSDLTNTSLLQSYQQNYSAVYIANRYPLVFDDPSIVNIANLTIVDNSPYGWFKKAMGRYYSTPMYVYKYLNLYT